MHVLVVSAGFGSWMGVVIGVTHSLSRQVGIDLGRRQGLVPEQFLDCSKIGAIVQQVGCK